MRLKKLSVTENKVFELLAPVVSHAGMHLLAVEYVAGQSGMVLRLIIDRDGSGVTLDDCAEISRTAGDILDIHDPVPDRYNLEVSSPGINRALFTDDDLVEYAGNKVKITADRPIDGRRRFNGVLKGVVHNAVAVEIGDELFTIPLENISKARLDLI